MRNFIVVIALLVPALPGCKKKEAPPPKIELTPAPTPKVEATPSPTPAPTPDPSKGIRVEGLQTPESVLYDDQADLYLVSNINGTPHEKDDNGFIARVSADGKIVDATWIDGKNEKVTLNAPKGMALLGDVLYVADIDTVRMFDRKTGEARGEVALEGTTFVNDLAVGANLIVATDTGLKPDFSPSGSDSVWTITGGKAKQIAKGKDLGGPNGVTVVGDQIWIATFGSGEVYRLGKGGKKEAAVKPPKGQLDGIMVLADGTMLVSSWEGSAIYAGKPEGPFEEKIGGVESPADFGFDPKRNMVLIPLFTKNALELRPWGAK